MIAADDRASGTATDSAPAAWGELDAICRRVHHWLYDRRDVSVAKRFRNRLRRSLATVPADGDAILYQEAMALLHELDGGTDAAIRARRKEIELMEKLQKSVAKSIRAGDYDVKMARSILLNRDAKGLQKRKAILGVLESKTKSTA
jgi:hypothetical protein